MLARTETNQAGAYQGAAHQVEGGLRLVLGQRERLRLALRGGKRAQIGQRQGKLQRRRHHLHGRAVAGHKGGAQRFMPSYHFVERAG